MAGGNLLLKMENDLNDQLTEEDKKTLKELGFGAAIPEEKHNVHSFLHKVATAEDTTKLGNLDISELGMPRLTLRTYKDLALISAHIIDNPYLAKYYSLQGENVTATSLSKDAKLINLAVIQKREIEDKTKPRVINKGWFKPKEQQGDNQQTS